MTSHTLLRSIYLQGGGPGPAGNVGKSWTKMDAVRCQGLTQCDLERNTECKNNWVYSCRTSLCTTCQQPLWDYETIPKSHNRWLHITWRWWRLYSHFISVCPRISTLVHVGEHAQINTSRGNGRCVGRGEKHPERGSVALQCQAGCTADRTCHRRLYHSSCHNPKARGRPSVRPVMQMERASIHLQHKGSVSQSLLASTCEHVSASTLVSFS